MPVFILVWRRAHKSGERTTKMRLTTNGAESALAAFFLSIFTAKKSIQRTRRYSDLSGN
jgi:hypothetical protein